jgi:RsiW-degrading membrane proteinase PrsW (M82 family)
VDDDDAVIVPAPDASVFFHKPDYAAKQKLNPFGQNLRFRQTFIPILLTAGFIMIGLAALHFLWHSENNPMGGLPVWLLVILFVFGAAMWGLATINMLAVKQQLDAQKDASPA